MKWRTVYAGGEPDQFPSQQAVYEFVDALRNSWAAGTPGSVGSLTVQVNDGTGWQPHAHINFAEEGDRVRD